MERVDEAIRRAREQAGAGSAAAAIASLRRLAAKEPRHAGLQMALAELLVGAGDAAAAEHHARRGTELSPRDAGAWNLLGYSRLKSGRGAEAVADFERALELDPRHLLALSNLCGALRGLGRLDEALAAMERMLATHPESEFAFADVSLLSQAGMARESAGLLRGAAARFPCSVWLQRDLCSALNYTDDAEEDEVAAAHARLGGLVPGGRAPTPREPDPERPLRVGLISPDFREHSVAAFLRPLLDCAGRGIVPVAYHCSTASDGATAKLRAWVEGSGGEWRDAATLSNAALAERIRADRIDIVVDLAGWTVGSRLLALAARPAPVQVSYLGYPNTTGLSAIDARVVDAITDPPGSESLATERLVRIDPCFLCCSPPENAPEPARDGEPGAVTFGSFNTIRKVTPTTVRLWSAALNQTPGSTMVVKSPGLESTRARGHLLELFREQGVAGDRLELLARVQSKAAHLALYNRIDVALDTYPYHGTTTTCEALWMGVPVVTLAGRGHRSRVGLSILSAVGLADLAVTDEARFGPEAAALAGGTARRQTLRRSLRQQMQGSPLCDHAAAADRWAAALRGLWRERVAGL
jgi:predicted O-linked N-acetylglucosamine transferase (SPINDLY family)